MSGSRFPHQTEARLGLWLGWAIYGVHVTPEPGGPGWGGPGKLLASDECSPALGMFGVLPHRENCLWPILQRGTLRPPEGSGEGPGLDLELATTELGSQLEELLLSQCLLPSPESSPALCTSSAARDPRGSRGTLGVGTPRHHGSGQQK